MAKSFSTENKPAKPPKKQKDKPPSSGKENFIKSSSICGDCFYNIPQGTHLFLYPGLTLLIIGIILLVWVAEDSTWDSMTQHVGIFCAAIGGGCVIFGLIYWIVSWCKSRRRQARRDNPRYITAKLTKDAPIQLVSVVTFKDGKDRTDGKPKRQKKKITAQDLQDRLQERNRQRALAKAAKAAQEEAANHHPQGEVNRGFEFDPDQSEDDGSSIFTHF